MGREYHQAVSKASLTVGSLRYSDLFEPKLSYPYNEGDTPGLEKCGESKG